MRHKLDNKKLNDAVPAGLKVEMAKPRVSKSARIAERNLDAARIPELPSTSLAGMVDTIIPRSSANRTERAHIHVDGPDHRYRDLRIENRLTDEDGEEVSLKRGAHVEVTVTTKHASKTQR